ncbi:transcriptional regulator [Serinibacter arcticus]|uniref:Transcriptional regulator n=1 Tax=Serinibacter arcticus TaxID=1655435 RepID=A0A2U1ZX92_9MICO|nr:WYL domain-containing protein [Serinibacter arcticus]PWD51606.1 transcriptional regulator [Serinibacter arcticus]
MTAPSSRLLLLLSLLQVRRDWGGGDLAGRLEVSPRTVRRDVDRLRSMGYRITALMGPDGGYRLEAGAELPPLLFDDEQAVAVAVALRTAAVSGVEIVDGAARALLAVRQVMPARLRHRIDAVEVTPLPRPGGDVVDPEELLAVSAAVRAREVLRFDYASSGDDDRPPRRVEPHHVVTHAGRWYLVAWDLDAADWRTYRVDRLSTRTPTGPRFAPRQVPGGDVATYVAARFKGSATANTWPCWGEAVLRLPRHRVAPFVAADDGVAESLGDDRTRVRLGAWSWPALAATIGRFDADVEQIGPPELAAAFAHLARRFERAASAPAVEPRTGPTG